MTTPPSPANEATNESAGRLFGVIKSIRAFDKIELSEIISSILSPTPRETCFLATYYQTAGIVDSLLRLDNVSHFQGAAMLTRALFELAVDIKLIDRVPQGWAKMVFFADVDKLRCARRMIAFANQNPTRNIDVSSQDAFVTNNQQRIEHNHKTLWPPAQAGGKLQKLTHWSGLNLADRAKTLGEPFDAMYNFQYPRLSWYVHPGLTGVLNLPAEFFLTLHGYVLAIAFPCYTLILESLIREMKIDRAVEKIHKALKLATLLPFSKDPEQEADLCRELLG